MNPLSTTDTTGTNGQSALHDLFALTDEQILEIEPEGQDAEVRGPASASRGLPDTKTDSLTTADDAASARNDTAGDAAGDPARSQTEASKAKERGTQSTGHGAQPGLAVPQEPPQWVAEAMNDPQRGGEARTFWEGTQKAQQEAAAYREVFAKPEEARSAAERARVLDDIDRAYFAGDASQRAQLATVMLREDPAAFREMVFAGLRALEAANVAPRSGIGASSAGDGQSAPKDAGLPTQSGQAPRGATNASHETRGTEQEARLATYAAFEKTANQELEQSVGGAIERALMQALPQSGKTNGGALRDKLGATIRQEIEKALQGDRQLGEQVAQILAARRLDDVSRSQVVRLIGERAKQLVPGAAKRVLQDWTQTTLAAHRGGTQRSDAAATRREVVPASSQAGLPRGQENRERQREAGATRSRAVDYRKLSDEQILEM